MIANLPTPALLVDQQVLDRNIARMAQWASACGVALRPHWKTSKCVPVAQRQVRAGAVGLSAATLGEVEALVDGAVTDVFWAYPPAGRWRAEAAVALAKRARIIVGLDSLEAATALSGAASASGAVVEVRLEVDTGLGRCGVELDDAVMVGTGIASLPGLSLEGVFTHEGNVQQQGADAAARQRVGLEAAWALVTAADRMRAAGLTVASVSVGSTPGAQSAPTVAGVTEMRPGTYVYGDDNQTSIGTLEADHVAATVLATVVSTQRAGIAIVDAGLKAMSSDSSLRGDGRLGTRVDGPGHLATAHEEHGFLVDAGALAVGDLVRLRPNHACGVSNMHSQVYAVDGSEVVDVWPIVGRH